MFLATYGSPWLQALVGCAPTDHRRRRRVERDLCARGDARQAAAELEQQFEAGGLLEAMVRALIYMRLPERSVDERGFAALEGDRALSCLRPNASAWPQFKEMVESSS